ncbi:MAG: hypothetical protein LBT71_10550 [Azoarcus sp.]|nr:hypothetical protein [Azoarcus sp.]
MNAILRGDPRQKIAKFDVFGLLAKYYFSIKRFIRIICRSVIKGSRSKTPGKRLWHWGRGGKEVSSPWRMLAAVLN